MNNYSPILQDIAVMLTILSFMYISWSHRVKHRAFQSNLHLLNIQSCVNDYVTKTSPGLFCLWLCNHKGVMQGTAYVSVHPMALIWLHNLDLATIAQGKPHPTSVKQIVINILHHLSVTCTYMWNYWPKGINSLENPQCVCDHGILPLLWRVITSHMFVSWAVNMFR